MGTPLKSTSIDFNYASAEALTARLQTRDTPLEPHLMQGSSSRNESDADDAGHYSELRYRMVSLLQDSLDLEQLLQTFYSELSRHVASDGMRFANEHHRLHHCVGRQTSHSCGYRLVTRKDYLGELVFYRSTRFSDQDLEAIETLISTILSPLRNALQYQQALAASMTDPLTGAGNRIGLNSTLEREIRLAQRYKHPLSLLVLDIDKFKSINDQHGHTAGDKVLQHLVSGLTELCRNTDACYRFGGEEFVIVLNRTDHEGALIMAERVRAHVQAMVISLADADVRMTVSIGATSFKDNDTAESLFNRADKALYTIKSTGGNRVSSL